MKISFLTSSHDPYDERIYWNMAKALLERNFKVFIFSGKCEVENYSKNLLVKGFNGKGLTKKDKINRFFEFLWESKPDIIICTEPLTILVANKYKKIATQKVRIIYDITEWYPSIRIMDYYFWPKGLVIYLKKFLYNYYISRLADSFIFGEIYKSKTYRFLFPGKDFIFLAYYPDIRHFPYVEPVPIKDSLLMSYSGRISYDRGFHNFIRTMNALKNRKENLHITINIIGWYDNDNDNDKKRCNEIINSIDKRISVNFINKLEYDKYVQSIKNTDIFLDLRKINVESNLCLPIKIFDYAALGRPVIYSKLKSLDEIAISKFGYVVEPDNINSIVDILISYIENGSLYINHCMNARKLAIERYNWKNIENDLIDFLIKYD